MGIKIAGEGQFDMLKKMGCEANPKLPPEAILDSGAMWVQVLKLVIPITLSPIVVPT